MLVLLSLKEIAIAHKDQQKESKGAREDQKGYHDIHCEKFLIGMEKLPIAPKIIIYFDANLWAICIGLLRWFLFVAWIVLKDWPVVVFVMDHTFWFSLEFFFIFLDFQRLCEKRFKGTILDTSLREKFNYYNLYGYNIS